MMIPLAHGHMHDAEPEFKATNAEGIERYAFIIMGYIRDEEIEGRLQDVTVRCYDDMQDHLDVSQLDQDALVPWGIDHDPNGEDPYEYVRAVQCRVDELLHSRPATGPDTYTTMIDD